jgi:hypothetical protein
MKTAMLLTTAAALALSAPAFAAEKEKYESKTKIESDAKGNYDAKVKSEKTDMDGTTSKFQKKVDVDVDSKGNTDTTVKTEESRDPKGLMNKSTVKTTDSEKMKSDGTVETEHKKTVDGKTVEDSKSTTH